MSDEYTKKEWVIEHDWKCVYCNHVNRGRDDKCSECGKDIDEENVEIVPSDMSYENRVTDTKALEVLGPGEADWFCSHCGHRERSKKDTCTECGALRDDVVRRLRSRQRYAEHLRHLSETPIPRHVTMNPPPPDPDENSLVNDGFAGVEHTQGNPYRPAPLPKFDDPTIPPPTTTERVKEFVVENRRRILQVGGVTLGVVLLVWFLYWLFAFHSTTARVTDTRWHYHVSLYQRTIENGHDWQGNVYSHATNVSCHSEVRSHHDCNPYSCNPHQESYRCRCHQVCHPEESCHTSCSSSGRRSSVCREVCSTHNECESECSTCYRTAYDTCYHQCPDYDQMCDYQYPAWLETAHADNTQRDHTIVRPGLSAPDNVVCPSDPEEVYMQNPTHLQCTTDSVDYSVNFDAGEHGHYGVQPQNLSEYNRYYMGDTWDAEYNHAGQFHALRNLSR